MRLPNSSNAASEAETEAALWLARLHADDRSREDDRAFRRWLDTDPANRRAFDHLTEIWNASGAIARRPYHSAKPHPPRVGRRQLILGGGAVVAAGAGLGGWAAATAGVYETKLGEQRHVTLDDGSLLFLDTDTKIRTRLGDTAREVSLYRGRCNFRVAPDAARPFVVEAGGHKVLTPRATFDVRRDGDAVSVTCISGSARVDGSAARAIGEERLVAGERLVSAPGSVPQVDTPDIGATLAWQSGQIVFDGDTLAAVAEEMNRYSPTKLVIADPRVAELRLSGSYRVGDNIVFANSLARLLPLRLRRQAGDIELAGVI